MSAQSPVPERQHRDLGLIETMLWQRDRGIELLRLHLARLSRSAAALGFEHDAEATRRRIVAALADRRDDRLRVRLVAWPDGSVDLAISPEPPLPDGLIWRAMIAPGRLDPGDPLIRHKTTRRALYDQAREAAKAVAADEALFLNAADELCEGAITSLFVERAGTLLTPALDCGLLPGVLRESLLLAGKAREARLGLSDLEEGFYLGNAVRGLIPARLAGA